MILSPSTTPLTLALIALLAPAFAVHFLLFFNASCARWLPTESKRSVRPSLVFNANWLVLDETEHDASAPPRFAAPDDAFPAAAPDLDPAAELPASLRSADVELPAAPAAPELAAGVVELPAAPAAPEAAVDVIEPPAPAHDASMSTPEKFCVFISGSLSLGEAPLCPAAVLPGIVCPAAPDAFGEADWPEGFGEAAWPDELLEAGCAEDPDRGGFCDPEAGAAGS